MIAKEARSARMPGSIGEQVQQVRNLKTKRMLPLMEGRERGKGYNDRERLPNYRHMALWVFQKMEAARKEVCWDGSEFASVPQWT
jgi:hypothetical protein